MTDVMPSIIILAVTALVVFHRELTAHRGSKAQQSAMSRRTGLRSRSSRLASKRNKHRTHKHNNRTDEPPTDILLEDDTADDDSKERAHAFDRDE
jgi:hypothetical protein